MKESQYLRNLKSIYFWACMIYISGATFLVEIDWLLIPVAALGYYCFYIKKLKWDKFIIFIILAYSLISLGSYAYNGSEEFSIPAFIGFYFRILIPYFLIKVFNYSFFDKYESVVYYGALISLPLFLILYIDPYFYTRYLSGINMSGELRTSVGYWNFFIYTTHGGDNELRNDGFAIEPGHFGYLLGVAIIFNLIRTKFEINNRLIIFLIAGLTTLSTTFYITLGIFMYFYSINNKVDIYLKIFIFIIVLMVGWGIVNSDLVLNKIDITSDRTEEQFRYGSGAIEYGESMNRFGAFRIEIQNFINYPFGYSINNTGKIHAADGTVVTGPNGFASFISFWGIGGILFLFYALLFLIRCLKSKYTIRRGEWLIGIVLIIYLFSNSISRDILFFSLLLMPFLIEIYGEKRYNN